MYRTAATASGLVASASEDNSVRLWSADGQCLQTIPHPGALMPRAPGELAMASVHDSRPFANVKTRHDHSTQVPGQLGSDSEYGEFCADKVLACSLRMGCGVHGVRRPGERVRRLRRPPLDAGRSARGASRRPAGQPCAEKRCISTHMQGLCLQCVWVGSGIMMYAYSSAPHT